MRLVDHDDAAGARARDRPPRRARPSRGSPTSTAGAARGDARGAPATDARWAQRGLARRDRLRRLHRASPACAAARPLLARGRLPTAIFAANDLLAAGVSTGFEDAGLPRSPRTSRSSATTTRSSPRLHHISLTTIDQPRPEMGQARPQPLVERVRRHAHDRRCPPLAPSLVVRATTVPARSGKRGAPGAGARPIHAGDERRARTRRRSSAASRRSPAGRDRAARPGRPTTRARSARATGTRRSRRARRRAPRPATTARRRRRPAS